MAGLAALDDLVGDAAGSDPEWADLTDQWPAADLHAALKRVVRRVEADFTRKRAEFQDATAGRLDHEEFRLIRRDYARCDGPVARQPGRLRSAVRWRPVGVAPRYGPSRPRRG